ncbi:hypothetical protein D3C77_699790 [compost metagenome]
MSREAVGVFIRKHIAKNFDALKNKVNSPLVINEPSNADKKDNQDNKDNHELPVMKMLKQKKFQHDPTGQSQYQEISHEN